MQVNKITNTNQYNKLTFKAHPEFKELAKKYNVKASSYFRRGQFYGSPSDEFVDVIYCLRDIFYKKNQFIRNMLIAGIGESQEPFSLLVVIKAMLEKKSIKENLDLKIVDMQSKPTEKKLFSQSYFNCGYEPRYMLSSFIKDSGDKYGLDYYKEYRVNDEIFEFLNDTYKNRKNSYWNSRIQDVIKDIPSETMDIVSINNTLGYIKDENVIKETINHIFRVLKKGGIFITDPYSNFKDVCIDKSKEIYQGIFKKY